MAGNTGVLPPFPPTDPVGESPELSNQGVSPKPGAVPPPPPGRPGPGLPGLVRLHTHFWELAGMGSQGPVLVGPGVQAQQPPSEGIHDSPELSSIGVSQINSEISLPPPVARPGPGRPGLTRFHSSYWSLLDTTHQYVMNAAAGSYAIAGASTGLTLQWHLTSTGAGSYSVTGDAATFLYVPTPIVLGLSPQPGDMRHPAVGRPGPGLPGLARFWSNFDTLLSRTPPVPPVAYTLTADQGNYSFAGGWTYIVQGQPATLVYTPAGSGTAYTFTASSGSYTVTGAETALQGPKGTLGGGGGTTVAKPKRKRAKVTAEVAVDRSGPEFSNTPFVFSTPKRSAPVATPAPLPAAPAREPEPIEIEPSPQQMPDRRPLPNVRPLPRPAPVTPGWQDPSEITDEEVEAIVMALAMADVL